MTSLRCTNCYDLMDSAYDLAKIHAHSRSLGHVPIIDANPRATKGRKQAIANQARATRLTGHTTAEQRRYGERTTVERVNSALEDCCGGGTVRVRGAPKVMCHLMFSILTLAALQLQRLIV